MIINAVECEPYLTADHQLMLEHAEEIMVGVSILMKAVKVNKAFIFAGRYTKAGPEFYFSLPLGQAARLIRDVAETAREENRERKTR